MNKFGYTFSNIYLRIINWTPKKIIIVEMQTEEVIPADVGPSSALLHLKEKTNNTAMYVYMYVNTTL